MVSLATLNDGTPDTKPWLTPVCYNMQTLNVDTDRMTFQNQISVPQPPDNYSSLYFNPSGALSTVNSSGSSTSYLTKVVQPAVAGPFVPQPLNSTWTVNGTTTVGAISNVSHSNTLITTDYANANLCQMSYSINEGKTWVNATSNIPFNGSVGFPTYGYSAKLQLAVFYSQSQYGTSLDGRYWTLTNQTNIVAITFASYDFIRYNEFYSKWFFIGDTQQVAAPGLSWGTFTITTRTITKACYRLAINQSNGVMVSVSNEAGGTLCSVNGGTTWIVTDETNNGYVVTWVLSWSKFVALLNGFYCTSTNGINWINTPFANIGLGFYGTLPITMEWIPQIELLVIGLRRSTGTYTPVLAYQAKADEIFKVTPITGGPSTGLELVSLIYNVSSGNLTIVYYTGQCLYGNLSSTAIVPSPNRLFIGYNPVSTCQYSTYSDGAPVNNTVVETVISGGTALGSLVFHPPQPLGAVIVSDFSLITTSSGGDTLTLRYKMNGVTILTHPIVIPAGTAGAGIQIDTKFVVRAATLQISSSATFGIAAPTVRLISTAGAYNPNLSNVLSITGQWGAAASTVTPNSLFVLYNFVNGGSLSLALHDEKGMEADEENKTQDEPEDLNIKIVVPPPVPPEYNSHEVTEEEGDFNLVKSHKKKK